MARIRPITQVRSGPATVSGSGIAPLIAAGAPMAQPGVVIGSGARRITSSGILVPASATVVGLAEPYPLSAYSIPFAYNWPTAPNITSEATVDASSLAVNNVNGRRLTLTADDYGDVSPADDQEWILQAGANIDDFNFGGSSRLKVRGETPRVGRIGALIGAAEGAGAGTTDILFDGIYQSNGLWTASSNSASNAPAGHRVAIVNSSLNTASYTLYLGAQSATDFNNIIIAGNYIRNDNSIPISTSVLAQHAVRFMSVHTYIFAGNYIEKFDDGIIWRIHCNSTSPATDNYNGFVGGNVLVRAGGTIYSGFQIFPASGAYTPGDIYDVVFDDNEVHLSTGTAFAFDETDWTSHIRDITLTNNFSNGREGLTNVPGLFPSFTISGNTSQAYNAGDIPSAASVLGWTP